MKYVYGFLHYVLYPVGILFSAFAFFGLYEPPYGVHLGHWLGAGVIVMALSWGCGALYAMAIDAKANALQLQLEMMNPSQERRYELEEMMAKSVKPTFIVYLIIQLAVYKTVEYFILTLGFGLTINVIVFLVVWGINFGIQWLQGWAERKGSEYY